MSSRFRNHLHTLRRQISHGLGGAGRVNRRKRQLEMKRLRLNTGLTVEHEIMIQEIAAYLQRKKGRVMPYHTTTIVRAQRQLFHKAAGRVFEESVCDVAWSYDPLEVKDPQIQVAICVRVAHVAVQPNAHDIEQVRRETNVANTAALWNYRNPNASRLSRWRAEGRTTAASQLF